MALIEWLTAQGAAAPRRLDTAPASAKGLARVETNLAAGSVILTGPKGDAVNAGTGDVALVWRGGDEDRTRALPPGEYRLRTTRVEKEQDGHHWFLSSTGPADKKEPLALEAGKSVRIDVADTVRFKGGAFLKPGKLRLNMGITQPDGGGLSVYRDDRRVPVRYRVFDAAGAELASGAMKYG